jgi:hypothetical protein
MCGFAAGYQSVRRFVRKLEADSSPEARVVIDTGPGEDYGESRVMVRTRRRPAFGAGAAALVLVSPAT